MNTNMMREAFINRPHTDIFVVLKRSSSSSHHDHLHESESAGLLSGTVTCSREMGFIRILPDRPKEILYENNNWLLYTI